MDLFEFLGKCIKKNVFFEVILCKSLELVQFTCFFTALGVMIETDHTTFNSEKNEFIRIWINEKRASRYYETPS